MKGPSLRRLFNEHAHLFHLGDMKVDLRYVSLEGLGANGMCFPQTAQTPNRCLVLIEVGIDNADVLPILLHELIHVEQSYHFGSCSHNAYFNERFAAILAAGYRIADAQGTIHAPQ